MDFYEILEVSRNATQEEIKKAYRRIALESHPDRNIGNEDAEQRFKKATEAYDTLSDINLRSQYDMRSRQTKFNFRNPNPQPNPQPKPDNGARSGKVVKRDLHIQDAPPPKFDLWGNPLSVSEQREWDKYNKIDVRKLHSKKDKYKEGGWVDVFASQYSDNDISIR